VVVVHCWADLQSVYGLRCYGNITRTRNVSEYMLVLTLRLVTEQCGCSPPFLFYPNKWGGCFAVCSEIDFKVDFSHILYARLVILVRWQ